LQPQLRLSLSDFDVAVAVRALVFPASIAVLAKPPKLREALAQLCRPAATETIA